MQFLTGTLAVLIAILSLAHQGFASPLDGFCGARGLVPAVGVGSVNLGDSFVNAIRKLGHPTKMRATHASDLGPTVEWRDIARPEDGVDGHAFADYGVNGHLLEVSAASNTINQILVWGLADCRDPHGIGAGTAGSLVIEQYGQSYSMRRAPQAVSVVYNSQGVYFGLTTDSSGLGSVTAMSVFLPDQFCAVVGPTLCNRYEPRLH
jgi:hypothetical protein